MVLIGWAESVPETLRLLSLAGDFSRRGSTATLVTHGQKLTSERAAAVGKRWPSQDDSQGSEASRAGLSWQPADTLNSGSCHYSQRGEWLHNGWEAKSRCSCKTCGSLVENVAAFRACCPVILLHKAGWSVVSFEWMGTESFIRNTQLNVQLRKAALGKTRCWMEKLYHEDLSTLLYLLMGVSWDELEAWDCKKPPENTWKNAQETCSALLSWGYVLENRSLRCCDFLEP